LDFIKNLKLLLFERYYYGWCYGLSGRVCAYPWVQTPVLSKDTVIKINMGSKYNEITYIYELSVIIEAYYFMQLICTNKNFLSIGQRNGTGCVAQ
jgi:hypothetical protein